MIDILIFVAGLIVGFVWRFMVLRQKRRVIFVKEEIFDVDDPNVPEDVRAQLRRIK